MAMVMLSDLLGVSRSLEVILQHDLPPARFLARFIPLILPQGPDFSVHRPVIPHVAQIIVLGQKRGLARVRKGLDVAAHSVLHMITTVQNLRMDKMIDRINGMLAIIREDSDLGTFMRRSGPRTRPSPSY